MYYREMSHDLIWILLLLLSSLIQDGYSENEAYKDGQVID